ncbi:hypothetical protein Golob_028056 [Gossypium lobatum]|uniref:Uncharacterized protein n=1 Tax=Gossypium lobatum TaxID=34289 RepID=A0A7J8NIA0_9ROSI|nr:hypothetical protein [Gossypium lobatum]MBA0576553.1 hypothetical protein [Gossypium lobatum]
MSNACNQTRRMKRFIVGPMTTPQYYGGGVRGPMTTSPGRVKKVFDQWKKFCKWSHLR